MKKRIVIFSVLLLTLAVIISCKKLESGDAANHSDVPVLPETPYDYPSSTNDNLASLGRVLFYDKNLSLNGSVSCASCHQQSKAFCDNLAFSVGLNDGHTDRNSPSIFARNGRMFWDGRAASLEDLVLRPIQNHVEMNFGDLKKLAERISKISYYKDLFIKATGSEEIDSVAIRLALTEFLKNFSFSNNKFRRSAQKVVELNSSEKIGKSLFFGRAQCSNCHHIDTANTGNGYGFTDVSFNIGLDQTYIDNGAGAITQNAEDNGKFMVPVLLNVEFTAPYMHDGRFQTLEEVVEHYNSGMKNHPNLDISLRDLSSLENMTSEQILATYDLNKDGQIDANEVSVAFPPLKLNLTPVEKKGLVDFLKTLSDPTVFVDKKFSNPFRK